MCLWEAAHIMQVSMIVFMIFTKVVAGSSHICIMLFLIALQMTEMELSKFFSQFGEVRDTKIITDRDGGKSRG